MNLLYNRDDLRHARKLRDGRFRWLEELGATELHEAGRDEPGFLFGYQLGVEALRRQVADRSNVRDRPEEREELVRLDDVLRGLEEHGVDVPTPRTWVLQVDEGPPPDLEFPLFVRTPTSSWKRGGQQAKVTSLRELTGEIDLLRRVFGWDVPILARRWLDLAVAGEWMFGKAPQEVRVWVVDGTPAAWSFHYLHAVPDPRGFPPSRTDLRLLTELAARVASPFRSRLVAADFVRDRRGDWHFLEAGPGAVAGTAHETVFKTVARRLVGEQAEWAGDAVGGPLG
jgi:hypothetical protein